MTSKKKETGLLRSVQSLVFIGNDVDIGLTDLDIRYCRFQH